MTIRIEEFLARLFIEALKDPVVIRAIAESLVRVAAGLADEYASAKESARSHHKPSA